MGTKQTIVITNERLEYIRFSEISNVKCSALAITIITTPLMGI